MKKSDIEILKSMLIKKETIKSESKRLKVLNTAEGLPCRIKSVESNKIEHKQYEGYNLLENTLISYSKNGVTYTKNADGTTIFKGTINDNLFEKVNSFEVQAGKTYRLSGCPNDGSNSNYLLYLIGENTRTTAYDYGSGVNYTATADETIIIRIVIYEGTVCNNLTFKPMLIEGSTEKPYEPYVGGQALPNPNYSQPIEGITGDVTGRVRSENFLEADALVQGYYEVNTGVPTLLGTNDTRYRSFVKELKAGTYTVCCSEIMKSIRSYPSYDLSLDNYWGNFSDSNHKTITLTENAIVYFSIRKADGTAWDDNVDKLWLVEDTEATAYTKPSTPITLSLGNKNIYKKDGIVHRNDKWQFALTKAEVVFDGSDDEGWFISSERTAFAINITDAVSLSVVNSKSKFLCNAYIYNTSIWEDSSIQYGFAVNNKTLLIRNLDYTSVEDFKAELQQNPITVVYELAEPIYEDITDPVLLAQLDKILLNLKEYAGETYIEFDQEVLFEADIERDRLGIIEDGMTEMQLAILEGGE